MVAHGGEFDDSRALTPSSGASPIELLRDILGLPGENTARLLTDPRFQELIEIVNLAIQVHGSGTQGWFVRPEPELGFVHPATLMRDPANGRKLVKQSLMNHLRGVYALGQDGRVLPKSAPTQSPARLAPPRAGSARLPRPKKKRRTR